MKVVVRFDSITNRHSPSVMSRTVTEWVRSLVKRRYPPALLTRISIFPSSLMVSWAAWLASSLVVSSALTVWGAAAQGANFQTYGVQLRRCAGYNGDIRSFASIGHSHGAAQSAGPSSYQGDFAFQLHLCFTFLQWQGRHSKLPTASLGPGSCTVGRYPEQSLPVVLSRKKMVSSKNLSQISLLSSRKGKDEKDYISHPRLNPLRSKERRPGCRTILKTQRLATANLSDPYETKLNLRPKVPSHC